MRIGILGGKAGWHARALADACRRDGHEPLFIDFATLRAGFDGVRLSLSDGFIDLRSLDRAIVRTVPGGSLEQVVFRVDVLHVLQEAGMPVLNPPRAIEACVDKHLASARLSAAGLPTPRTVVCQSADQALRAFNELGGDVVVKPIFGAEGRGVLRVDSQPMADRVFRTLERMSAVSLLQEFIPGKGYDIRILLAGDEAVGCMRRWPAAGDFRANINQGGRAEPMAHPPGEWIELAQRAARALGAPLAGVDLLPDRYDRPVVLEVNSSPGFRALSTVTGLDIAARIVDFAVRRHG